MELHVTIYTVNDKYSITMPPKNLKSKPLMLYVSEDEMKLFKKHAKKQRTPMSKFVKNAALFFINTPQPITKCVVDDDSKTIIDDLKSEIDQLKSDIVQLKSVPTKGDPDRMATSIFEYLKDIKKYASEQQLHDIFEIETEEQHTDFTIALHQLQMHYGDEITFNDRYGWRYKS